jgi:hypothetical protein
MAVRHIPPEATGIPFDTWYEQELNRMFAEARERYSAHNNSKKAGNPFDRKRPESAECDQHLRDWLINPLEYDE